MKLSHSQETAAHCLGIVFLEEDPFGGKYSGNQYLAWYGVQPENMSDDENRCRAFWENNDVVFGGGNSPDEALCDLFRQIFDDESMITDRQEMPLDSQPFPDIIFFGGGYGGPLSGGPAAMVPSTSRMFRAKFPRSFKLYNETFVAFCQTTS